MGKTRLQTLSWAGIAQSAVMPVLDVAIVWASTAAAYFLRFQGVVPLDFLQNVVPMALLAGILFPVLFYLFRLYHHVWRYAGIEVALKTAGAVAVGFVIMATVDVLSTAPGEVRPVPLGTLLIMSAFVFLGSGALRFYGRMIAYVQSQSGWENQRKVLIVGAGNSGSILIRDISSSQSGDIKVMGLLDDDSRLHNRLISDVRVLGSIDSLSVHVKDFEVDEVFLAIPSASSGERRRILDICSKAGVKARVIPQLAVGNQPGYGDLRRVEIEDLLGRDSVRIDTEGIRKTLAGRVIAVTGAAGSIGAELCRQIAMMRPAKILLIEIDESRLYEIFLELRELGTTELVMHVCDIRDDRKLSDVFRSEKPEVVLHAAAYKHVPLMELAPDEAIKTNVGGTRNVLAACEATGVENFVLISTDKAVSPTTVMGLTKAIAERLMIDACRRGMKASAVRFGNVLGSRGSVVPLFEEQLRRGRPLRVTHPDVTRYFMTIPEAARLVLQAQALSEGGEIFVLEMGEPVKIVDLAQKMITLSGADSSIEFSGLRPAEKLHEVLVAAEEELLETGAEKIDHVSSLPIPPTGLDGIVNTLGMFARLNDRDGMKVVIGALMPDFVGYGENLMVKNEVAATGLAEGLDSEMETLF